MRKWIEDIRQKTADMDRKQAFGYIAGYYWYHILIVFIMMGIMILLVYHIGWGDRRKEFTCVIINQETDYARDKRLAKEFGAFSDRKADEILIDSDYQISYGDKQLESIKESSYEKFFFNWQAKEIDAMVMPQSFYDYCLDQGGEFMEEKIPVEATRLGDLLTEEDADPVYLVFAADTKHKKACAQFREYLCE